MAIWGSPSALDMRQGLREDLRLLIMSATLDAAKLSEHLQGAPRYSGERSACFRWKHAYLGKTTRQTLSADACKATQQALLETKQSILVFLPGEAEIRRTKRCSNAGKSSFQLFSCGPLYGRDGFASRM
jgi:ATP-dependent helicase HrpB